MPEIFNNLAAPKIETKRFKMYIDVGASGSTPVWELQGRGVDNWTIDLNSDIEKTTDVLGYVDMDRSPAQPTQTGVRINLLKGSAFAQMLHEAEFKNDYSKLNNMQILKKYEYVDGTTESTCVAKLEKGVMISINSFAGEAGSYLGYDVDIHYANDFVIGSMPKTDGDTVTFTPDTGV